MAVISINKHNFKQEIEEASKPVVIEVYATWCGPCQHMMPIFEELEEELKDKYTFAKLNVDEAREIAIAYNISSVPTFLFIKDNKVASQERGYMSKEDLKSKIEELLG
ncbi:thioredoxin [Candidatus Babela massiliensis]|uniref:Thioredoxin n=1 Tax=Candidatus Babela massiliensis TaxID=673862 RepID=V6DK98_9BACT|nr:thioredoxin [Candidatus Babela massiliensis]CDK30951.1 thioredoxin [Candidatus Babela massiliensis]